MPDKGDWISRVIDLWSSHYTSIDACGLFDDAAATSLVSITGEIVLQSRDGMFFGQTSDMK